MNWKLTFQISIIAFVVLGTIDITLVHTEWIVLDIIYAFRLYFAEFAFIVLALVLFPEDRVIRQWLIPLTTYWLYLLFLEVVAQIDIDLCKELSRGTGHAVAIGVGLSLMIGWILVRKIMPIKKIKKSKKSKQLTK